MAVSSSRSMPRSSAAKVTARYMAPVSSLLKPSWRAISLGDGGFAGTGGAVDGDDHAMLPFGG